MSYIDIIRAAGTAKDAAAAAYVQAESEFESVRAEAVAAGVIEPPLAAESAERIIDLVKRYGPKIAMLIGGPAAGATVTGFLADDGAFSTLLKSLGAIFGIGI